jgi:hypothetical protein
MLWPDEHHTSHFLRPHFMSILGHLLHTLQQCERHFRAITTVTQHAGRGAKARELGA